MTAVVYIAACLAFCAGFAALKVVPSARRELSHLWMALATLNSADLSDEQKEAFVRKAGIQALSGVSRLFARLMGVMAAAIIPVWLGAMAGLVSSADVARFAIRYDVMAVTTIAAYGLVYIARHFSMAGRS